jgi:hypothetical protein
MPIHTDHTFKNWLDIYLASLEDHYQSQGLLFGMWGNVLMAQYYNQLAKIVDNLRKKMKLEE